MGGTTISVTRAKRNGAWPFAGRLSARLNGLLGFRASALTWNYETVRDRRTVPGPMLCGVPDVCQTMVGFREFFFFEYFIFIFKIMCAHI